ncbi:MAG: glycosyltransferase family 1 protein [Ramlibacter sp.]|jgi:glycosyltransferase involved in cell wall biosynthesis|nr:glycosyltransferase family 1 protein [Ramlibacter sp.]
MLRARPRADVLPASADAAPRQRFIYIACPWAPVGGGMYKVADYLIQSQATGAPPDAARLRPLDTRGTAGAVLSLGVLATALARIAWGRLDGGLAGVHVNMGERMSLFRKGVIVAACRAMGVPVVLHLHAQMETFYRSLPALPQRLARRVFLMASGVVVIGPAARRFVLEVLRVPAQRVDVVINGVPEAVVAGVQGPDDGPRRLLFVGNLSDRKGLLDLLHALARPDLDTTNLRVTLVGGGDLARYRRKAREMGLESFVRFEGWCDQARTRELLASSYALVLPSHDEVLPLAILEALAHGVAVVTTPVGEIPALLTDGCNALFVAPRDPASLAAGLQRVLHEPGLRESLASNGRQLYEQRFGLRGFFARVASVHRRHFGVAAEFGEPPAGPPS